MTDHDNEYRSIWERLDDDNRGRWFDEHVRWTTGNLSQAIDRMRRNDQGGQVVAEAEALLRSSARPRTRRMRSGEPGE